MTRPYVRVFQRHPATELPEMQKVMRASTTLGMSVEESMKNLQLLKQAKERLNADLKDKRAATSVSKFIFCNFFSGLYKKHINLAAFGTPRRGVLASTN